MASPPAATKPPDPFPALLAWYDRARRDLPWRAAPGAASDPYAVLVSEIMLQQTTVVTVAPRFNAFLDRFPTLDALAAAPLDDVLHAWQGLGYYRRARALHACARALVHERGGAWPRTAAELATLPGIGPYTAAAIAAIAFGEPVLAVDGNVERVLARLWGIATPLPQARPELRRRALALGPPPRPADSAQAFIELGALVCRPRAPACPSCPLASLCVARAAGLQDALPRRAAKSPKPQRFAVAFHLVRADGAVAFRRRPPTGLLGGMMELPSTPWGAAAPTPVEVDAAAPVALAWTPLPGRVRHVFTHFTLAVEVRTARLTTAAAPAGLDWCRPEAFATLALPTLTRKLVAHAGG